MPNKSGVRRATRADRDQVSAARAAVDHMFDKWPNVEFPDAQNELWSDAAVEHIKRRIQQTPGLIKAGLAGSDIGAESLNPRPFQGILETIQNADDLGATTVRIAIRSSRGRNELLVVHNGSPLRLEHVGAMVVPWVTTKAEDSSASGRFGIGQKTLRALGGVIELHCQSFHFRMENGGPVTCEPVAPIEGLYSTNDAETLVKLDLHKAIDPDELINFITELSTDSLVFLRSVRQLSLIDLKAVTQVLNYELTEKSRETVPLKISGQEVESERLEFVAVGADNTYIRYMVEMPTGSSEQRQHKAHRVNDHTRDSHLVCG